MNTDIKDRPASNADHARWAAVIARDASVDRQFVFAVRTTGIYCRPSCPARRPKRENTQFFDDAGAAERAGYRACKRCKPTDAARRDDAADAVKLACTIIESADEAPRLAALATAVGLSPSHFHRQFKARVGITPREYAAECRLRRLKDKLTDGESVTDAIFDAGYGSGSRVYENAATTLGMTPGSYRSGGENVAIEYALARCELGRLLVAATERGICCIELGDTERELLHSLGERFARAQLNAAGPALRQSIAAIVEFIHTPAQGLDLPLDIQGTAFQRRVWKALQGIAPGETASYREVAERIGAPNAHRAVASACARNKLALAVPCHRVVRSDGTLGGYRWGVERKARLLELEREAVEKNSR